jgi:hypothetical protein
MHRGPPTSLLAQTCFRPVGRPSQPPRRPPTARRARAAAKWGRPCVMPTSASSSSRLSPFAGVERGKPRAPVMAPSRRAPAASRRIGAVHVPPRPAAISSRRRRLWISPTLAARGNPIPCSPTRSRRRGGRRGGGGARSSAATAKPYLRRRRDAGAAREEEPDPREPRTPSTSACSTSSPPYRSATPTSAASLLVTAPRAVTDACTSARGHPGEDAAHLPSVRRGLRAATERHRAAAPPLVMPAFEPGWVAVFCRCRRPRRRARRPPSFPFSICVRFLCRPSPPRRVERRVAFARRTCPRARTCARHGARTRAPQHARVATVRARPDLDPSTRAPPWPAHPRARRVAAMLGLSVSP